MKLTAIAFMLAVSACTAQQGVILKTGISTDIATVACVISSALASGGDLGAIAAACGADIATATEILIESADTKSDDAGISAVAQTKAYAQARASRR